MEQIFESLWKLGHSTDDSPRLKVQKGLLVSLAVTMSLVGLIWGTISLTYGLLWQSLVPYGYTVVSFLNMHYLYRKQNIVPVRFVQILISLIFPFVFQFSLGGFAASGVIMLWAILSLVVSMSFQSTSSSIKWLGFYLVLMILSSLMEDFARSSKPVILQENSLVFLMVNLALISSIIFILVGFYVFKYEDSERQLAVQKRRLVRLKKYINTVIDNKVELEEQLRTANSHKLEKYGKILAEQQLILSQSIEENKKLARMITV